MNRILLIGGGAKSEALRVIAPTVFGRRVEVPASGEYVAIGAARQAAWALSGADSPPSWPVSLDAVVEADAAPQVREQYARYRALELTNG